MPRVVLRPRHASLASLVGGEDGILTVWSAQWVRGNAKQTLGGEVERVPVLEGEALGGLPTEVSSD